MSGGSLFHWFGPDTEKPRRPNLSVLARGTTRSPWSVERSCGRCTSALTELQISCKYIGADPLTQLRTSIQILNVMRWRTGNQCSVSRMAVVIRPNLGMFSISQAEEFCIDCRRRMTDVFQPNRAELQRSSLVAMNAWTRVSIYCSSALVSERRIAVSRRTCISGRSTSGWACWHAAQS